MPGYPLQGVMRLTVKGEANKEVKLEIAAPSGQLRHRLLHVLYSYGGSGTLGNTATLTVEDGLKGPVKPPEESEAEKIEHLVAVKGAGWVPLGWRTPGNVTVKLAAGGENVTGSITLVYSEE